MNQIRALKPGEFVFYNSRVGVVEVTTRWLLSLHKGPLTNSEIKKLTLRPPEKVKKTVKKKTNSKKESLKKEKEIQKDILVVSKKPTVAKKNTERYLKPRINPESPHFPVRLRGRLSISGDPKIDSYSTEYGDNTLFYSPIYYSKTEIKLKRVVKEKNLEIPIEIGEEMIRTFDLTKSIAWKSISVEGIHPAALLPQELELSPLKQFQFIDMKMDVVDKLPENLVWYYSSSPFPEADKLYSKSLREFEVKELEKLVGDSKDFAKLNKEISKIEERLENEKSKIKDYQSRLEFLENEKQAKEEEGRSTKGIDRSIESSELKLSQSEESVKDLETKKTQAEDERKQLTKERQAEYEQFEKDIEYIKEKGTPGDLYRPEKAEIKIVEDAIYWVPRVLVPLTLKNDETEQQIILNFNLYNGNAEISCHSCGPAVSTENYYQALLESEISPPTFVCNVDLKLFCSDHVGFCTNCGKTACIDHTQTCELGEDTICSNCKRVCTICGKTACPKHSWQCAECKNYYCSEEESRACEVCNIPYCLEDTPNVLASCNACKNMRCLAEHSSKCDGCGKIYCNDKDHLKPCKKCESTVCDECGRVRAKLKGEEIIARCIVCS